MFIARARLFRTRGGFFRTITGMFITIIEDVKDNKRSF